MKRESARLFRHYQAALRTHLERGPRAGLQSALGLGRQAMRLGLETLDLARIHERTLMALVSQSYSAGARDGRIK